MNTNTPTDKVLSHLKSGKSITLLEAFNEYSYFRLGTEIAIERLNKRVSELEKRLSELEKATGKGQ